MSAIRRDCGFAPAEPAIYYDRLTPEPATGRPPLVLIHGAGHSGACYLATPDGRDGWAVDFAERGFPVLVPDWPGTGRSGAVDGATYSGAETVHAFGALLETLDEPAVVLTHSMSGVFGWKLMETHGDRLRAVIGVAPSPPGNIQPVSEILERGEGYVVVQRGAFRRHVDLLRPRPFEATIVDQKLIGEGSTQFPREATELYRRSLLTTPARIAYERSNIEGSQLRLDPARLAKDVPVLVVSAGHDPDHTPDVDGAIADWFAEIGIPATFAFLPDHGITGNGHMMMLERNSADIAGFIADWIEAAIG